MYHFTHLDNVPGMLAAQVLCCDALCASTGIQYRRIGDAGIKLFRQRWSVRVPPYGCIGDYVPFYVAPRSPMLYRISAGGVAGFAEGQRQVVYLVSSVAVILAAGLQAVFTDGQANHQHSKHYPCEVAEMWHRIDWSVMTGTVWKNTEADPQRRRRRQAEVLVHRQLPWSLVEGLAARTAPVAARLEAMLRTAGCRLPVVVRPGWYY